MFRAMFNRAFQGAGVYAVDCRIGKGQLFCKWLFVDAAGVGDVVTLKSVDDREFWLKVKLPVNADGIRTEDYILEIIENERIPF
ncbi:MAG: hypothetical protein DDT31_00215 [Syntrophomonadaceae bacterium]|nr:hypothetical protein [Bacillota bacterium]